MEIFIDKGGELPDNFRNFYLNVIKNLNDLSKLKEYLDLIKKEVFPYITEKQDFGFPRE